MEFLKKLMMKYIRVKKKQKTP